MPTIKKSFRLEFNGKEVFTLKVSGDETIVEKLTTDIWFNSALRQATEKLIENTVHATLESKGEKR